MDAFILETELYGVMKSVLSRVMRRAAGLVLHPLGCSKEGLKAFLSHSTSLGTEE